MNLKEKYFKTGNLIETNSGELMIVWNDGLINSEAVGFHKDYIDSDLNFLYGDRFIAKIYEPINDVPFSQIFNLDNYKLVWEREEKTPLDWTPEKGDHYYYLGSFVTKVHRWDDDDADHNIRKNHRIYKTREEAEKELEINKAKRRVEIEIARLNDGWKPNWKDHEQPKYSFYYAHSLDKFRIRGHFEHQVIGFYLKTEELAEQLIKSHEEDLKLIFGVEDND